MRRRILSLLMAFAMVLGMLPVAAMAENTSAIAVIADNETVSVEFNTETLCYQAQIPSGSAVTITDSTAGEYAGMAGFCECFFAESTNGTFELTADDIDSELLPEDAKEWLLPDYPFLSEGEWVFLNIKGANGENSLFLQVVENEVPSGPFTVTLTEGTTYTIAATQESTSPVVSGGSFSFTVYPAMGYNMNTAVVKANDTVLTAENEVYTIENITADQIVTVEGVEKTIENQKTVTAPAGAEVHVYYQNGYANGNGKDKEITPVKTVSNGETVTYYYSVNSAGGTYMAFYGDKIPYAGYFNSVDDVVLSWDGETKTPAYRGEYDQDTVFGSRGEDSVYTNVNSNGHLVLNEEFMLRAYRGWQIVNSDTTNVIIEPEFTYETNNSNLTITPYNDREENDPAVKASGTSSNNWVYLTPTGSGITYLEIGYDAVHIVDGWEAGAGGGAEGQPSDFTWNASDPNRTALIVVQTDGNAASGIKYGIQSPSGGWDYEYDTVYFTESQGSITMKPTGDVATVSVSHNKGGSYQTITGVDGTYVVPIIPGNNIIRITDSSGKTAFQVVRGEQISYTVTNLTTGGDTVSVGDEVRIDFHGMHTVCPKISGIYNPGYPVCNMLYYKVNGSTVAQSRGYQYDFHSNVWLEFEAGNADCVLTGGNMVTPPSQGSSIGALYQAAAVNSSHTTVTGRNILPDITIEVEGTEIYPATGITLDKETASMSIGANLVLTAAVEPENTTDALVWTSSEESVATVENGTVTALASGETIITVTAGDHSASCTVTVTDREAGSFTLRTEAVDWTVEGGDVYPATSALGMITVSGPVPVGDITGDEGPEWSVNVAEGTGDTVTVSMTGVAHPMAKSKRWFWYNGTCSDVTLADCTNDTFTVTLEPEWKDDTTTLTLGLGSNKQIQGETYTIIMTRVAAEEEPETYTVTLPENSDAYTIEIVEGTNPVEAGGSLTFQITPAEGYDSSAMAVKVNGDPLDPADAKQNIYILENINEDKTVTVEGITAIPQNHTVTLNQGSGYTLSKVGGYSETVSSGGSYGFTVKVNPSYVKGSEYAVKVNGTAIQPQEDGTYLIENITENKNISVTGVEPCMTNSVDVYLSVSKASDFITKNNKTIALQKFTVPYFDLALYGYEEAYYNPDCYAAGGTDKYSQVGGTPETANGKITSLHLFIYATEVIYNNLPVAQAGKGWLANEGEWNGYYLIEEWPGSTFGSFWDFGEYNTYFLNYEYPLGRATWGASCDQIVLSDGDIVSIRYKNTNDWENMGTYYHFGEKGLLSTTAKQGEQVTLSLYKADENYTDGAATVHTLVEDSCNVYVTANSAPASHASQTPVGTTENGQITLDTAALTPGTYYVTTDTHDPAVMLLMVEEAEQQPEEPDEPEVSVLYGDLDGNGIVAAKDAAMAYAIAKEKLTPTEAQRIAADVDGNGSIAAKDAAMIYAKAKEKLAAFPVESN